MPTFSRLSERAGSTDTTEVMVRGSGCEGMPQFSKLLCTWEPVVHMRWAVSAVRGLQGPQLSRILEPSPEKMDRLAERISESLSTGSAAKTVIKTSEAHAPRLATQRAYK